MDYDGIDWERLDRYVTGRGTPEELDALERWVDADPELRALADAMRTAGRPAGVAPGAWDTRAAWRRTQRFVRRPPLRVVTPQTGGRSARRHPPTRRRAAATSTAWRALAAAAVVVVALGSALFIRRSEGPRSEAVAIEMREATTDRRQRMVLTLPDGSRVTLAPESRLRVPTTYSPTRGPRNLYLEGQAHFEVEHDGERPFRVHAATGVAEDLGTEFVVTAYPETDGMEVLVASGVVALHARSPEAERTSSDEATTRRDIGVAGRPQPLLTLSPGDLAHLDTAGTATLTRGVDVPARVAWTEGSLVFDGTRFGDAIPVLERWYDIEFRPMDERLADRRLTAMFGGEPLQKVLELLALSLELDIQQNGPHVTVTAASQRQRSP